MEFKQSALHILNAFERDSRSNRGYKTFYSEYRKLFDKTFPNQRGRLADLLSGIFRNKGKLDAVAAEFSHFELERVSPLALNALRIGLYEMMFRHEIPHQMVVNNAVGLAARAGVKTKAFVNGTLREIARNRTKIPLIPNIKNTMDAITHSLSYPEWIARMLLNNFGKEKALKVAHGLNQNEPLTARLNTIKADMLLLESSLKNEGFDLKESSFFKGSMLIEGNGELTKTQAHGRGLFYIQNTSSQIVSPLLNVKPGETVLDACAGPGGKATHLCQIARNEIEMFACDISKDKLKLIEENSRRLGTNCLKTFLADAGKILPKTMPRQYDRILADAPCSALGTIRKNPDVKWTKSLKDVSRLSKMQIRILENLFKYLKKGGTLLYSVCTFTEEETKEVCKNALVKHKDIGIDPIKKEEVPFIPHYVTKEGYLFIEPLEPELESFFVCRFVKS